MCLSTLIVLLYRGDHSFSSQQRDPHRYLCCQTGSQQRVGHGDDASPRSSLAFEEDTKERPGVAPTAGEKGQGSGGHDNNAPDTNRDTALRRQWGCL